MQNVTSKRALMLGGLAATTFVSLLAFQNCSKAVGFSQNDDLLSRQSDGLVTNAQTEMNTPRQVNLRHEGEYKNVTLTLAENDGNGTYRIDNPNGAVVTYTPPEGFRGDARATFTVKDRYGSQETLQLVTSVSNGLSSLQPALAVRGLACTQCHAAVGSNVITDFGYGGDGRDRNYFFVPEVASLYWHAGAIYGDHGGNFHSMKIDAGHSLTVPAAELPKLVQDEFAAVVGGSYENERYPDPANTPAPAAVKADAKAYAANAPKKTIVDYVKAQFGASLLPAVKNTAVDSAASIYIGAPTAAQLASQLKIDGANRIKFFRNDGKSKPLSGLTDKGTYVRNEPGQTLICDGDVGIQGPLYLDNLSVDTISGCRLYVIGSVFIFGPITYTQKNGDQNLQISSSRTISMGLGQIKPNGQICEKGSNYDVHPDSYNVDVLVNRYVSFYTVPGQPTRENKDAKALGADVVADARLIEAGEGKIMLDASCRPEGRQVNFDRVLLNAPSIHSRYKGNVDGTVIAEYVIMSLGAFKFTFDPVFAKPSVPVLPFLSRNTYLNVIK